MKLTKLLLLMGLTIVISIFNSCKKNDSRQPAHQKDEVGNISQNISPHTLALLKQRMENEGKSFTVNINKNVESFYSDKSGKRINPSERRSFVSACTGFTDAYTTLVSYQQNYDCINGYKLSWKYQISTDNKIVTENPNFPSQKSKGLIRIFNVGTGTPAYVQSTYQVQINDLGPDPIFGTGYESYSVEFTSDYIPESYINDAMAYKLMMGANLAIDCDNGTAPVGITITDYGFPNYGSGSTCDRNDRVWIIPGGGINMIGFAICGIDLTGTCPVGYSYPTWQEVEYSVDGGAWKPVSNATSPYTGTYGVYGSKYLFRWDVAYPPLLSSGTYTYIFRYRNVNSSDIEDISKISCENTFYTYETWEITY